MPHLIVPGLHGSSADHWQSWWLARVPDSRLVEQKDWSTPTPGRWGARLREDVARAGRSIVVAHSLGCALVADVARNQPDLPIDAALLVAPADVDEGGWVNHATGAFGPMPMTRLPFPSTVVASRNDPYVSVERAQAFAKAWGAGFVDYGEAGHINAASGFGPWEDGIGFAENLARTLA